jgi:hypothetical protein
MGTGILITRISTGFAQGENQLTLYYRYSGYTYQHRFCTGGKSNPVYDKEGHDEKDPEVYRLFEGGVYWGNLPCQKHPWNS